jgi:hypothetical protein
MRPDEHPLTPEVAASVVDALASFRYYPQNPKYDSLMRDLIDDMCPSAEAAVWVVKRAFRLWNGEWKGPQELRAILCSKYSPADGETVYSQLKEFRAGIPPENPVPGPVRAALPPGRAYSADPQMEVAAEQMVGAVARKVRELPELSAEDAERARKFGVALEEVLTAPEDREPLPAPRKPPRQSRFVRLSHDEEHAPLPPGSYRRITQEDIDRAVRELREKRGGPQ